MRFGFSIEAFQVYNGNSENAEYHDKEESQ